ncbi:DUF664 domain-containing protein [Actinoplanes sp. M2I2]|uniref:mycothiol transferase n=1 Tax=Actinoplanes sp. M2I2 TaxID=1734444 RepID=UPI0020221D55|nr:DUF664 domain-containing protein [Actinoplanes sp. M2I2]
MTDTAWEPPLAGTELEHLLGALERLRTTFRWKADDLTAEGLNARLGASALTLGGLLKHLALVEDYKIAGKFGGEPLTGWDDLDPDDDDWEFTSAAGDRPEDLYARYDDAVERCRARLTADLAEGGFDRLAVEALPDGSRFSLRRIVFDLVEEYGRHTGHADLLREAVDGRTGEDPPHGWRPVSGHFTLPRA